MSAVIDKIPMQVFHLRNYKGHDETVTLLQACYDNPLFQEEEAKFSPDIKDKKLRSSDYLGSKEKQGVPEVEITERDRASKTRKLCIIAVIVIFLLVFAFIVGYLINTTGRDKETKPKVSTSIPSLPVTTVPSYSFKTERLQGQLHIVDGPYSKYTTDFQDKASQAYKYLSESFIYKISQLFSKSVYGSYYNFTTINRVKEGSVIVSFTIHLKFAMPIFDWTEDRIESMLASGLQSGVIIVSKSSINITAEKITTVSTTTQPPVPGTCVPVNIKYCVGKTDYKLTTLPNALNHKTLSDVQASVSTYKQLFLEPCYGYALDFWCSALNPQCNHTEPILPCKDYCEDVKTACAGSSFPLDCNVLPSTSCRKNPYKPGKCIDVPNGKHYNTCISLGFSQSALPNYDNQINFPIPNTNLDVIMTVQNLTGCYKHSALFGCSVYVPKCSGSDVVPSHTIPPCKSFCHAYKENCFVFWEIFGSPWPVNLNCSALPDVNDTSVCIGYDEAHQPPEIKKCKTGEVTCDGNRCIDESYLCDGYQDCEDNADEVHCAKCSSWEQKCNPVSALCVNKTAVCNGVPDCFEGVDEAECVQLGNGSYNGRVNLYNAESGEWEEICYNNWNETFSDIVCHQLGYRTVESSKAITQSTTTSVIDQQLLKSKELSSHIQMYLTKSAQCPGQQVVHLVCGNPICGNRPAHYPSTLRIVNGKSAAPGTWPSMVGLFGGYKHYFCGASLISQNWVLTAAHCIGSKRNTDGVVLRIGDTRRHAYNKYLQIKTAKKFYVHEDYSPQTVMNDIALIELDSPVFFNDYVRPMCIPQSGYVTPFGTRCFAAGWGKRNEKATEYESELKQVNLDVASWEGCKTAIADSDINPPYKLTRDMLCAGGSLGHDACSGDSGGPLLCPRPNVTDSWYIAGVVSWGLGCAIPNVPGIYTEVQKYIGWIQNKTNNQIYIP